MFVSGPEDSRNCSEVSEVPGGPRSLQRDILQPTARACATLPREHTAAGRAHRNCRRRSVEGAGVMPLATAGAEVNDCETRHRHRHGCGTEQRRHGGNANSGKHTASHTTGGDSSKGADADTTSSGCRARDARSGDARTSHACAAIAVSARGCWSGSACHSVAACACARPRQWRNASQAARRSGGILLALSWHRENRCRICRR